MENVLITGGCGGLGLIVAEHFAAKGPVNLILTGRSPKNSHVWNGAEELAPIRLTAGSEPGCVRVVGINAFKGMEAPVVILTELNHLAPQKARQMHYIGASRAVHHLIVLEDAVVPPAEAGAAS